MSQNIVVNTNGIGENADVSYPISDDDLEYDDCDEFMDEGLLEGTDLPNKVPTNTSVRGPYERAWTTDATRALIHIRGPLEGRFTEGRQKRTALWLQCTRQLQRLGYRYSAAKVQKKWHNILITYNKNLNKKYLSGYVHWEFFEEMFKYLEGKKANFDGQQQQQQQQQQPEQPHQQQQLQQQQQHVPQQQAQPPPLQQKMEQQPQALQPSQPQQQQQLQIMKLEQQIQQQLPKLTVKPYTGLKQSTPNLNRQPILKQAVAHYVDPQSLLQPHVQLETRSNDDYDEDSGSMSELRQPKIEFDEDVGEVSMGEHSLPLNIQSHVNNFDNMLNDNKRDGTAFAHGFNGFDAKSSEDSAWWKEYFERKLTVEREKLTMQRGMHRDLMQYHKTYLVQQEKIERIKIDAINNLTTALQKLVEAKSRKN